MYHANRYDTVIHKTVSNIDKCVVLVLPLHTQDVLFLSSLKRNETHLVSVTVAHKLQTFGVIKPFILEGEVFPLLLCFLNCEQFQRVSEVVKVKYSGEESKIKNQHVRYLQVQFRRVYNFFYLVE